MKLLRNTMYMMGAALFAFSSGCVAYKPPPDIIHAEDYTPESTKIQRTLPLAYKSMSVDDAINIALANNTTYQKAKLSVIKAYAIYYGSLNASFGGTQSGVYGRENTSTEDEQVASPGWYNNSWSSGISSEWKVFNGLQDTMNALSKLASAKSDEFLEKDARRTLVYSSVIPAYNAVLLSKAKVIIDEANLEFQQEELARTRHRYEVGKIGYEDVLQWEINVNTGRINLITDQSTYQLNRYALAALLGLTNVDIPDTVKFPLLKDIPKDEGYALGVEFYIDSAIRQRPDIKSKRELLKAAKYDYYKAWGAFSPTATLNWSYSSANSGRPSEFSGKSPYNDPEYTNSYGFTTEWILWDGNDTSSRIMNVRQYQADYDSAKEDLLAEWISVIQDVRTAYTNLTASVAQERIARSTVDKAREMRDIVSNKYNVGKEVITRLNDAQNLLIGYEEGLAEEIIDVFNARAQLNAATGKPY